jgi:hypothetical protein
MKRLVLGLVVILFSIETIGCDSGGGGTAGSPAPGAGEPAKGVGGAPKGPPPGANPDGPKNDR